MAMTPPSPATPNCSACRKRNNNMTDSTRSNGSQISAQASAGESVFVMPNKYIVQPPEKSGKGLTILIIILSAVILLTGGYLVYDMLAKPAAPTAAPTANPPQIIIETPASAENESASSSESFASTTSSSTSEIASSTPEAAAGTLKLSLDSDSDGLTDIEETVLGTLPTNPDSDGDGYKDGAEVSAGYSPTKAGSARIGESPFVARLDGSFTGDYITYLMPKDWQSSAISANKQILISASTGEIIKITISDNRDNMTILGWYLRDHPEASVSQLKTVSSYDGALSGIYSPDGLTAWLTDAGRTKMVTVEYLTGRQTEIRYPGLFDMIIKSLTALASMAADASYEIEPVAEQLSTI